MRAALDNPRNPRDDVKCEYLVFRQETLILFRFGTFFALNLFVVLLKRQSTIGSDTFHPQSFPSSSHSIITPMQQPFTFVSKFYAFEIVY